MKFFVNNTIHISIILLFVLQGCCPYGSAGDLQLYRGVVDMELLDASYVYRGYQTADGVGDDWRFSLRGVVVKIIDPLELRGRKLVFYGDQSILSAKTITKGTVLLFQIRRSQFIDASVEEGCVYDTGPFVFIDDIVLLKSEPTRQP